MMVSTFHGYYQHHKENLTLESCVVPSSAEILSGTMDSEIRSVIVRFRLQMPNFAH